MHMLFLLGSTFYILLYTHCCIPAHAYGLQVAGKGTICTFCFYWTPPSSYYYTLIVAFLHILVFRSLDRKLYAHVVFTRLYLLHTIIHSLLYPLMLMVFRWVYRELYAHEVFTRIYLLPTIKDSLLLPCTCLWFSGG